MRTTLKRVGNSQGVIIPKPLLAQIGLEHDVEIDVEDGAIVLRKPQRTPREGWAAVSRAIAGANDDGLLWPEFDHAEDRDLAW